MDGDEMGLHSAEPNEARVVKVSPHRPETHVITTEEMVRLSGHPTPAALSPARERWSSSFTTSATPIVAFCGFILRDARGSYGEAASVRALRASPSLFEGEAMCAACVRAYAVMAVRLAGEATR